MQQTIIEIEADNHTELYAKKLVIFLVYHCIYLIELDVFVNIEYEAYRNTNISYFKILLTGRI